MQKNSQNFSMQEALRLANSDAGQQLLALLKQSGGEQLQQAMAQASSGDYTAVKDTLAPLLSSPQMQALLKQLEE